MGALDHAPEEVRAAPQREGGQGQEQGQGAPGSGAGRRIVGPGRGAAEQGQGPSVPARLVDLGRGQQAQPCRPQGRQEGGLPAVEQGQVPRGIPQGQGGQEERPQGQEGRDLAQAVPRAPSGGAPAEQEPGETGQQGQVDETEGGPSQSRQGADPGQPRGQQGPAAPPPGQHNTQGPERHQAEEG